MQLQLLLLYWSISVRQAQNKIFFIYRFAPSGHFDQHSTLLIATRKNTSNVSMNVTPSCGRVTIAAMEKQRSITYSGYVFVILLIQYVKGMHRIILSTVACPPVPRFCALSNKRYDFQQESCWIKIFLLIFCTASVWSISHPKKNSTGYKSTWIFM
jgi:hypothetical protein